MSLTTTSVLQPWTMRWLSWNGKILDQWWRVCRVQWNRIPIVRSLKTITHPGTARNPAASSALFVRPRFGCSLCDLCRKARGAQSEREGRRCVLCAKSLCPLWLNFNTEDTKIWHKGHKGIFGLPRFGEISPCAPLRSK
jgi:hypothetical protein